MLTTLNYIDSQINHIFNIKQNDDNYVIIEINIKEVMMRKYDSIILHRYLFANLCSLHVTYITVAYVTFSIIIT